MVAQGYSYRRIAVELQLSKTTVNDIVKRDRVSKYLKATLKNQAE